jgi:hypothetical protein
MESHGQIKRSFHLGQSVYVAGWSVTWAVRATAEEKICSAADSVICLVQMVKEG